MVRNTTAEAANSLRKLCLIIIYRSNWCVREVVIVAQRMTWKSSSSK